MRTCSSKLSGA